MNCVYCKSKKTAITNSRATKNQTQTWRRHYCNTCKRSFSSFEKPDMKHLAIDTNGALKPYSRSKLYLSVTRSFQEVGIDHELLDSLNDTIEVKILSLSTPTLTSQTITELVLQTLKPISKRAYLHYLAAHSN
jgi:transcriptional repressor NrdR